MTSSSAPGPFTNSYQGPEAPSHIDNKRPRLYPCYHGGGVRCYICRTRCNTVLGYDIVGHGLGPCIVLFRACAYKLIMLANTHTHMTRDIVYASTIKTGSGCNRKMFPYFTSYSFYNKLSFHMRSHGEENNIINGKMPTTLGSDPRNMNSTKSAL